MTKNSEEHYSKFHLGAFKKCLVKLMVVCVLSFFCSLYLRWTLLDRIKLDEDISGLGAFMTREFIENFGEYVGAENGRHKITPTKRRVQRGRRRTEVGQYYLSNYTRKDGAGPLKLEKLRTRQYRYWTEVELVNGPVYFLD